jgi:hypothetical protein
MINMGTWVVFVKGVTVAVMIVGCSIKCGTVCGIFLLASLRVLRQHNISENFRTIGADGFVSVVPKVLITPDYPGKERFV